ncbi:MAG TPA: S9 family peptidase, partial [Phycisphaerae bacterium]
MAHLRALVMSAILAGAACIAARLCFAGDPEPGAKPYPATTVRPVPDEYHGVRVTDDYRWLEDWNDAEVRAWSDAQNRYARQVLDQLPSADAIRKRVTELMRADSVDYSALRWRKGRLFALKQQPPKQQPFLITLKSADEPGSEHVIVDPNRLDEKGTTAIDFFVPSIDGKLVAVSLSEGGSESGTVYVYETATGEKLEDVIPRV